LDATRDAAEAQVKRLGEENFRPAQKQTPHAAGATKGATIAARSLQSPRFSLRSPREAFA
jgi:hypothetical protein